MPQHPAYHIHHIHLDRQSPLPAPASERQSGSYLVYWWKDLALGHLFLKPGEVLADDAYLARFTAAIQPAVEQYNKASDPAQDQSWKLLLQRREFGLWTEWLANHLASILPETIPASVPVSAIICTRNRADQLKTCLQNLLGLRCVPQEILVVDNAPADETTLHVVNQFAQVTYIRELRPGLDIARNTGLLHAQNEIVAYVDDDVRVHPLWAYGVWHTFQDSAVAAMTGLVIAAQLQTKAQVNFEKYWSFNRGYAGKTYTSEFMRATMEIGPPVWEIGAGANMAFRKSVFREVGLFNELLDVGAAGCNGDSEMWHRILSAGFTIKYNPRAIVFHEHRRETKGLKRQLYYYMRGFTVAALLQQERHKQAGYRQHLLQVLPKFYIGLIRKGFPRYTSRTSTIWAEMKGMLSGFIFYKRHQRQLFNPTRS
ncbi:glycosyltransferase family 2 protein [Pontibacter litorisediminis]|uniref:glycosyltransferase family 2 protein n=1 Tax=Pontibacter litorisediminis TaxID=1846260 RepID=UPI0023EBDFF2|nr:glycosyltransferase [Pontibacter litorisediminis]